MLGLIIDSRRGSGDAPSGRGNWPRKVPLVGAVVLIPMLASAVAQAFQARNTEGVVAPQAAKPDEQKPVVVKRGAEKPAAGQPGGFFTGSAGVDRLFPAKDPSRVAIASVTFEPGARTAWHSHPLGQTLVVTEGTGWVQGWGGKVQEIKVGDVVHTPPNQKHWHGATATTRMTHISVVEHLGGKNVEVMERVSDEQYRPWSSHRTRENLHGPTYFLSTRSTETEGALPMSHRLRLALMPLFLAASTALADDPKPGVRTLTGKDALGDFSTDAPGLRRKITVDDLATPYDTPSAMNFPRVTPRPEGAWPKAPEGFEVTEFAKGLSEPRVIVRAPNGDLFLSESRANRIRVFRDADGDGKPEVSEVFATGLRRPFGIAFYPLGPEPKYLYVGNTDSVVRIPYKNGDTKASGGAETIVKDIPSGNERVGGGGHWTRDLEFSPDGKTLYVSVGSRSNNDDNVRENRRARILAFDPDGRNERVFAHGIRNPVGLATNPVTKQLWMSVNERDGLGDHLVPDYITHVEEGGFYGWPWYYIGPNQDPRYKGKHPELKDKAIVPDVLLQSHMASIDMTFYDGDQFPKEYRHDAFASEHGSWNRARRTGYKVIRVPMKDGKATGEYEDFLVGFVTKEGNVWGRPAGVAVAKDGSLMVTDDGSGTVWRVAYTGKK